MNLEEEFEVHKMCHIANTVGKYIALQYMKEPTIQNIKNEEERARFIMESTKASLLQIALDGMIEKAYEVAYENLKEMNLLT